MRKRSFLVAVMSGATTLYPLPSRGAGSPVRVAAASDLEFVLAELAQHYHKQTGQAVQLNLGSSGQFARQIRQGLPVDLFMAADEDFVFQLADAGLTQNRGDVYALGRLAALVPAGSPIGLDPALRDLKARWSEIRHFAIANPEHAPYGRAAQQALQRLGLWDLVQPKLVLGENVAQATQFITSGAAQAGITAVSLARAPQVAQLTAHIVLPGDLHQPLRQRMVLLKSADDSAADFYRFLQSPAARALLERYGFSFN